MSSGAIPSGDTLYEDESAYKWIEFTDQLECLRQEAGSEQTYNNDTRR